MPSIVSRIPRSPGTGWGLGPLPWSGLPSSTTIWSTPCFRKTRPPDWANYGALISTFEQKYGMKVNSVNPDRLHGQKTAFIIADVAGKGVPGALVVPPGEVERRLASLTKDREIVAYCRGPYCVYAVEAVKVLRRHGLAARRMEQGIPEWRLLGHPVEVGLGEQ